MFDPINKTSIFFVTSEKEKQEKYDAKISMFWVCSVRTIWSHVKGKEKIGMEVVCTTHAY